jgi:hypothetical protein
MSRSFAYLGIPQWHIFIGEVVLGFFLLLGPRLAGMRWTQIAKVLGSLQRLRRVMLLFLGYGIFEVLRGWYLGYPPVLALRDCAFNYYPLYLLLGIWAGLEQRDFLPRCIRILAWFNGVYGLLFILFLNRVPWFYPGTPDYVAPVALLASPQSSTVVLLGLVAFEPDLKRVWHLLLLNSFVLLGMQIRGEWLAFGVGVLAWAWTTKHLRRAVYALGALIVLIALMYALNFSLASPEGRGGTMSFDLVGRALAPINPSLAANYTSESVGYEATAIWRTVWWAAIWESVNGNGVTQSLLGHGYGFPLSDLVPSLEGQFQPTPHSVFFYALGYSGWVGVALFALFQAQIFVLLRRVYCRTKQPFGFMFWGALLTFGLFEPFFEAPYGAIPFYLMIGAVLAPLLVQERTVKVWAEA